MPGGRGHVAPLERTKVWLGLGAIELFCILQVVQLKVSVSHLG